MGRPAHPVCGWEAAACTPSSRTSKRPAHVEHPGAAATGRRPDDPEELRPDVKIQRMPSISTRSRSVARYALASLTARRFRRATRPAGLVLVHHGISTTTTDHSISLSPPLPIDVLREQLRYLQRRYHIVALSELTERLDGGQRIPRVRLALTFDDDLASHHELVAPLLVDLGLPATFFLTGAGTSGSFSFWWLDLEQLFKAGGDAWDEVRAEVERIWGPSRSAPGLWQVARTIQASPPAVRDTIAERLRSIAAPLVHERGLSASEVAELASAGFEIGFHTRRHYQLQTLTDTELAQNLEDGRDTLSQAAGQPLSKIAYPHGAADLRIAAAAARAGFRYGFTTDAAAVAPDTDPLLVPRLDAAMPVSKLALTLARLTVGETRRDDQPSRRAS